MAKAAHAATTRADEIDSGVRTGGIKQCADLV
jgi:hypothetical protein